MIAHFGIQLGYWKIRRSVQFDESNIKSFLNIGLPLAMYINSTSRIRLSQHQTKLVLLLAESRTNLAPATFVSTMNIAVNNRTRASRIGVIRIHTVSCSKQPARLDQGPSTLMVTVFWVADAAHIGKPSFRSFILALKMAVGILKELIVYRDNRTRHWRCSVPLIYRKRTILIQEELKGFLKTLGIERFGV